MRVVRQDCLDGTLLKVYGAQHSDRAEDIDIQRITRLAEHRRWEVLHAGPGHDPSLALVIGPLQASEADALESELA